MNMSDYLDLEAFCQLAAEAYPPNRLFCLADHAGMPGLHGQLLRFGLPWASLFQGGAQETALAAAPLLFPLDPADARFLDWLTRHGTYTSSMLMLSTPLDLQALHGRLAARLCARVSEKMDVLLRFFDPRVFEALVEVLDEAQRKRFLGPADGWWYPDRSGELASRPAAYVADEDGEPLELSAAQEFALLDASEIDQVAAQLQSLLPDVYIRMTPSERVRFLLRHMRAAKDSKVVATHEVSLYCGLALLHGEDFAQMSPWKGILAQTGTGSIGFADAVAAL